MLSLRCVGKVVEMASVCVSRGGRRLGVVSAQAGGASASVAKSYVELTQTKDRLEVLTFTCDSNH